jgi:hypothetical protein
MSTLSTAICRSLLLWLHIGIGPMIGAGPMQARVGRPTPRRPAWHGTVTRRDGSVHRYTERRGRHPEIGEVIEVRDAIGPPLIARIQAIHHDSQAPGALGKWNVAAIEIEQ